MRQRIWSILLAVALLAGCSTVHEEPAAPSKSAASDEALVQFSLIAALAAGDYMGGASLQEVLASGDFGIGTFDGLDGEMIVLDGKMYQAMSDGSVQPCKLEGSTPFAVVTNFQQEGQPLALIAATLEDLDGQLDRKLPRRNSPYAIRIDGTFPEIVLRSVPAQVAPFRPLTEVVKHQTTWRHKDIGGTLVGIRCPAWVGTLNVPGYHWHFLSADRKIGGHVLGCQVKDATLVYDECDSLVIRIPTSEGFDEFDHGQIKQQDINKIERERN
jgi:acetolactate decarboxylase